MEGLNNLNSLPDSIKEQIIAKYDSLQAYYDLIYNTTANQFTAAAVEKNAEKAQAMENFYLQKTIELEEMARNVGIDLDGDRIVLAISDDFSETKFKINPPMRELPL